MPQLANDHVKTIGPEVDRRDDFRGSLLELVFYVICGDGSRLNGRFSRIIARLSGFRPRHLPMRRGPAPAIHE
jgi:hypothetical protein